jgi:hypothetical protein
MIYKTLYLPSNPNFEYQKRMGKWYRRPIKSSKKWTSPNADGIQALENAYSGEPALFFYTKGFLGFSVVAISLLGYLGYKKLRKI